MVMFTFCCCYYCCCRRSCCCCRRCNWCCCRCRCCCSCCSRCCCCCLWCCQIWCCQICDCCCRCGCCRCCRCHWCCCRCLGIKMLSSLSTSKKYFSVPAKERIFLSSDMKYQGWIIFLSETKPRFLVSSCQTIFCPKTSFFDRLRWCCFWSLTKFEGGLGEGWVHSSEAGLAVLGRVTQVQISLRSK